ncbi:GNAT family N-acetyltransferase [Georgenia halophila]|uniref:GNAT family N-acetyltransferase n=1 Tax=Georgenia halophila TaxID=620889 RepID=A0ABP8L8K9_9MICO
MNDGYEVHTGLDRLDLDRVHRWLSTDAYWAMGRTADAVRRAAENSLNFGAYAADGRQVAYARVVTDEVAVAWICDVYVDRGHRGRGIGTRLAEEIVRHLAPLGLKRVMLATDDAHEVYARAGFVPVPNPERLMELAAPA